MSKRVYISADYDEDNGDRLVVEELNKWGQDALHKVNFIDMSEVKSGTVANTLDCRICDLKAEFNRQINASSAVVFIVGDMTAKRTAGSGCYRMSHEQSGCKCTPYKKNFCGAEYCKVPFVCIPGVDEDFGYINSYSYLRHEFEQAKKKEKTIIILYNSIRKEVAWLPDYMKGYEDNAVPFWIYNSYGQKVGNYSYVKSVLGF
ncbi:hypothetical protein [Marseilla massiliensis]|uniref:MTH538 TIR-like domain n=1 Tax=Marseilla massiliensis TaxID=1841864 RepID=A0A939B5B0_9BACT|nr:hypothetical protein [Marseilla massiliensis]MBM6662410.1 hypothetical protein [Marseilla massiliensis]